LNFKPKEISSPTPSRLWNTKTKRTLTLSLTFPLSSRVSSEHYSPSFFLLLFFHQISGSFLFKIMSTSNVEINDLISHTNALHFTDPSLPILGVPLDSLSQPPSFILVGKLISIKPIAKSVIKSNILQAWQFLKSLVTEDKEDNKMVFIFEDLEDFNRVLQNSPWNIKGTSLFLKRWCNDETFEEIEFVKAPMWVQVHGLPLDRMNNANATIIVENLGGLVEVDNSDCSKPCRKSFLRIRVLLPLEDPLPTGFILHRPPKQQVIISYQFERLSEFCYACGRLGICLINAQLYHIPLRMASMDLNSEHAPLLPTEWSCCYLLKELHNMCLVLVPQFVIKVWLRLRFFLLQLCHP
jgi:hypothetical protein